MPNNSKTINHLTKVKKSPILRGDLFLFLDHQPTTLFITSPTSYFVTHENMTTNDMLQIASDGYQTDWKRYKFKYLKNIIVPTWMDI